MSSFSAEGSGEPKGTETTGTHAAVTEIYAVDRPQIQSSICHQRDFQSNQTQSIKLYYEM